MRFVVLVFTSLFFCASVHADDVPTLPFKIPVELLEAPGAEKARQKELSMALETLSYEKIAAEATEDMRDYALYALFISFISSVLLLYTLYLNSRAASAANAAAEATLEANKITRGELRPWVTLESELMCEATFTNFGLTIYWNYNFRNLGKSPAYDVRLHCKAVRRQHYGGLSQEVAEYSRLSMKKKDYFRIPIIFPGQVTEFLPHSMAGLSYLPREEHILEGIPMLLVCLTYRLEQGGDVYGCEGRIFQFENSENFFGPFAIKMLEHSEARYIA